MLRHPDHEHGHRQACQAPPAAPSQCSHQEESERQADADVDEHVKETHVRPAHEAHVLQPGAGSQVWPPEVERNPAAVHDECSDRQRSEQTDALLGPDALRIRQRRSSP